MVEPGAPLAAPHPRKQIGEDGRRLAAERDVDADVLVDLGRIDLDVDLACVDRVGAQVPGDAIVEAHADRDEEIGLLHGAVHPRLAVHPHHPDAEGMRGGEGAEAQESTGHGELRLLHQLSQDRTGLARLHSLPGEDERALALFDERRRAREVALFRRWMPRGLARAARRRRVLELDRRLLRVLGDVDQHGTGTTAARQVERFAQRRVDVLGAGDEIVVLGDRERDAGDVRLLERVGAEDRRGNLPGDEDDRRGIHHRRCDAGDEVRRSRSGSRDGDAYLAGSARIAVGHVRRSLLVPDQHVADRVLRERVVGRHDRAARISEDHVDAFGDEGLPDRLCSCPLHRALSPSGKKRAPRPLGAGLVSAGSSFGQNGGPHPAVRRPMRMLRLRLRAPAAAGISTFTLRGQRSIAYRCSRD